MWDEKQIITGYKRYQRLFPGGIGIGIRINTLNMERDGGMTGSEIDACIGLNSQFFFVLTLL